MRNGDKLVYVNSWRCRLYLSIKYITKIVPLFVVAACVGMLYKATKL